MSAFLIVNGMPFPTPKRGFKITVLTNVDSGVNAFGAVVGQVIGRNQYKLDSMQWDGLDAAVWEGMLKALEPYYIPVTFEDPQTRKQRTVIMYSGAVWRSCQISNWSSVSTSRKIGVFCHQDPPNSRSVSG